MVQRVGRGVVVKRPGLSPWTGTHTAPLQPLGYGIWLPIVTPESGGLAVLFGVYPSWGIPQTYMGLICL